MRLSDLLGRLLTRWRDRRDGGRTVPRVPRVEVPPVVLMLADPLPCPRLSDLSAYAARWPDQLAALRVDLHPHLAVRVGDQTGPGMRHDAAEQGGAEWWRWVQLLVEACVDGGVEELHLALAPIRHQDDAVTEAYQAVDVADYRAWVREVVETVRLYGWKKRLVISAIEEPGNQRPEIEVVAPLIVATLDEARAADPTCETHLPAGQWWIGDEARYMGDLYRACYALGVSQTTPGGFHFYPAADTSPEAAESGVAAGLDALIAVAGPGYHVADQLVALSAPGAIRGMARAAHARGVQWGMWSVWGMGSGGSVRREALYNRDGTLTVQGEELARAMADLRAGVPL